MAGERRLADNIRAIVGARQMNIYQGIVSKVEGITCCVRFGSQEISDIRLRASMADSSSQIIFVPRIGSAVIVGSLSGDLSDLVVLQMDEVDRIEINGGQLGGLINIEELTEKLNNLVSQVNSLRNAFNMHTHLVATEGTATAQTGEAAAVISKVSAITNFNRRDYEDTTITH